MEGKGGGDVYRVEIWIIKRRGKKQPEAFWLTCVRHTALHGANPVTWSKGEHDSWGWEKVAKRKPSWHQCSAGRRVTPNIWCLLSWERHRLVHWSAFSSAAPAGVESPPRLWMISSEGGDVTWSNGTSGEKRPPAATKMPRAMPSQTNKGFQRGTHEKHRSACFIMTGAQDLESPAGLLFSKGKSKETNRGYVWDSCSSRLQVTQSPRFLFNAC